MARQVAVAVSAHPQLVSVVLLLVAAMRQAFQRDVEVQVPQVAVWAHLQLVALVALMLTAVM